MQTEDEKRKAADLYMARKEFIDHRFSSIDTFRDIVGPFLPEILERRQKTETFTPSLNTQLVSIIYPSTQSLERRLKGKVDEPIMSLGFERLDSNQSLLENSPAARAALASNNKTTIICVGTFMPTSMLPGGGVDSALFHSVTGINL